MAIKDSLKKLIKKNGGSTEGVHTIDDAVKALEETGGGGGGGSSDWGDITNKPSIMSGEGENSIVEGAIIDPEYEPLTIYITGDAGSTSFSYTPKITGVTAYNSVFVIDHPDASTAPKKYQRAKKINTTAQTVEFWNSISDSAITSFEVKIYKDPTYNIAKGAEAHAEGKGTFAASSRSHAEGYRTFAGMYAHAEGQTTAAMGNFTHAEGSSSNAIGSVSHAEGDHTLATGQYSHAEGRFTIASGAAQHVQGKFNIEDTNNVYADIVGNGPTDLSRSNAYTLDWDGNGWFAGKVTVGADPSDDMDLATKKYVDGQKFIVNFNLASGTADKTFAEIKAAYNAGAAVEGRVLMYTDNNTVVILPLAYTSDNGIGFGYTTLELASQSMYVGEIYKVVVNSDDTISIYSGTFSLASN